MKTPVLDATLLLGVLATCTQAADFLIRPAQKLRIQVFVEIATLHLEELRPLEWLKLFRTVKARQVLYLTTVCGYQWHSVYKGWVNHQEIPHDQMVVGVALFILGLPFLVLSYWYGPFLVGWLYSEGKLIRFLERWLLVIYTAFFGILLCLAGLLYAITKATQSHLDPQKYFHVITTLPFSIKVTFIIFILFTCFELLGEAALLATVGAAIVAAYILAFILELGLKMLRAAAWRIVEYNKGAFPAIVLVLTSFIGLLKLYLDHH